MSFPTLQIEGGLIPADIIDEIVSGDAFGQAPEDFGSERQARLSDEIASSWADARAYWNAFQRRLLHLEEDATATSLTREQWIIPLLEALGYEVTFIRSAEVVDGNTYAISHRANQDGDGPPIHIEGSRIEMDRRPPSGRPRLSPHGLMQEYLNRTEHLWGMVTNGRMLRLLRDNMLMSRASYG